jgi:hypothetical protein
VYLWVIVWSQKVRDQLFQKNRKLIISRNVIFNERFNDGGHQSFAKTPQKELKTKNHTPLSIVGVNWFEEGWEPDDDVVINHASPQEVITLEHAMNNTILEHDIATPKVRGFEVVLLLETTVQERHLENS